MTDNIYTMTVTVAKRSDLECPSSFDEAETIVRDRLENGSFLTVLEIKAHG